LVFTYVFSGAGGENHKDQGKHNEDHGPIPGILQTIPVAFFESNNSWLQIDDLLETSLLEFTSGVEAKIIIARFETLEEKTYLIDKFLDLVQFETDLLARSEEVIALSYELAHIL